MTVPEANRNINRTCVLCLEELVPHVASQQQTIVTTRNCHHHFHQNCLVEQCQRQPNRCPYSCPTALGDAFVNRVLVDYTRAHPNEETDTTSPLLRPADGELDRLRWSRRTELRAPTFAERAAEEERERAERREHGSEEGYCEGWIGYIFGLIASICRCAFSVLCCQDIGDAMDLCMRDMEALPVPNIG